MQICREIYQYIYNTLEYWEYMLDFFSPLMAEALSQTLLDLEL